ncbi:flavin reductase (DIM6/NTAB) family NADH-FMN oxidoreductase RutF [Kitasatospora gansuensis]|uniref:Flavin reductase (DIM6/NTAB) family NADH-FMN oxidoreductase RutF n=1 Tax=Kitasatospora gansuensis TaxID=258050 RepID=A0A7W7SI06_9ACTN|nr:flavin reductase family protein [Kitasatospora gansuensis]MBB4950243.1 flavin reductase (DIM6/NTAB) family NADH-FMN oxidoreductase RutF [Kitasatospora gansuensis]
MALDKAVEAGRPLRAVLGRYATGVAVVTTRYRGHPAGVTVNSFTSVSLEPPLVLWCLQQSSTSRAAFTGGAHFAVNLLAADQRDLAVRFAGPGDRFAGLNSDEGRYGIPLLDGAVATLVCRREQVLPVGDHLVLIGRVLEHWTTSGAPLLFVDGGFHAGPDGSSNSVTRC